MTAWDTARRALALQRKYRQEGPAVDVYAICEGEGLTIDRLPLRGRLRELIFDGSVCINTTEGDPHWVRFLIAHALGHHVMDYGHQLAFWRMLPTGATIVAQRENRADRFGRLLLVRPDVWLRVASRHMPDELADLFQVPEEVIWDYVADVDAGNFNPRAWTR